MNIERHAYATRAEWLAIKDRFKFDDVSASVIAAIPGLHPHQTALSLYYEKSGMAMPAQQDNKAMRRGRLMESSVAEACREEHPNWTVMKADEYVRVPSWHIGATPDFWVFDNASRRLCMQAKTVSPAVFAKEWTPEAPPTWISLQNACEVMVDDADAGLICALVVDGWNFDFYEYEVPRNEGAEKRLREMVAEFWDSVAAGKPPHTDYARDARLLPILFPREEPGKEADLRGDNELPRLLDEREQLNATIKAAEDRKEVINAELKHKIADAEIGLVDGWRITYRLQTTPEHTVPERSSRVLRVARRKAA